MNPSPCSRTRTGRAAGAFAADAAALAAAAAAAYVLAASVSALAGLGFAPPGKAFADRALSLPLLMAGLLAWFFANGHHHGGLPFWDEARKVFAACAFALLSEGFLQFVEKADGSRLATVMTWAVAPFAVMAARMAYRRLLASMGLHGVRVAAVGRPEEAARAARAVTADGHLGYEVVASIDPDVSQDPLAEASAAGAAAVLVALSGDDGRETELVHAFREAGYRVILAPPAMGFAASGLRMQYVIGEDAILLVERDRVAPGMARALKRCFDVTVAAAALAAAAIPMLAVAAAVRMDGGPAVYSHRRVGRDGRQFGCLKFRSMAVDADRRLEKLLEADPDAAAEWEATRKLKDDPRITAAGRFIRMTALDELPQLFNVLKGDMSLVGPRPVTEPELGNYGDSVRHYLSVRPGLTGLWQVSGRNDLSYGERVALDAWYVRNWSAWHDLAILLKTVPAVLGRRGAY